MRHNYTQSCLYGVWEFVHSIERRCIIVSPSSNRRTRGHFWYIHSIDLKISTKSATATMEIAKSSPNGSPPVWGGGRIKTQLQTINFRDEEIKPKLLAHQSSTAQVYLSGSIDIEDP